MDRIRRGKRGWGDNTMESKGEGELGVVVTNFCHKEKRILYLPITTYHFESAIVCMYLKELNF